MDPRIIMFVLGATAGYAFSLYWEYRKNKNSDGKQRSGVVNVNVEEAMHYDEVLKDLQEYGANKPKMDEPLWIREIQNKYEQDRQTVVRKIREVRREEMRKKHKKERWCIDE